MSVNCGSTFVSERTFTYCLHDILCGDDDDDNNGDKDGICNYNDENGGYVKGKERKGKGRKGKERNFS